MGLGLITRLRLYRRPAVIMAAGLIVMQALLAGLTMAQAALLLAPNHADVTGFAVICHGNGGTDAGSGSVQDPAKTDPGKSQHACCESCVAGPQSATLPEQLVLLRTNR